MPFFLFFFLFDKQKSSTLLELYKGHKYQSISCFHTVINEYPQISRVNTQFGDKINFLPYILRVSSYSRVCRIILENFSNSPGSLPATMSKVTSVKM